ncbi:hypothetical protein IZ6_07540 [Terrihabitans soli]|uniref:DNA (cytosine-5-)-methyltransferase n=1 Tax=Terrihabitans soli TaxID=708113 RepID=A0A6S6QM67_9HYPH|nr:DNA cytosine methyltransferase [Terrihabitans soli]BCJ90019.1 hypothetical protein IZ6_07540 [Terrihabitans soli]
MNVHTPSALLPFDYIAGGWAERLGPQYRYILDYFAGGGGASEGIKQALGRSPDFAINHDPEALALHEANHPETTHLQESVFKANPFNLIGPKGKIGLVWYSPDCKHFSKAKGGKPVEKEIRGLAWVVPKTIADCEPECRPDVIILENVEEFQDWGPLTADNMPDKSRKGEEFKRWTKALRKLGYVLEWRELRACDFGAPTIRKRFFLIGRRDGKPIVWPEPTHKPKSVNEDGIVTAWAKGHGLTLADLQSLKPWRTAAEIIDWSKRGYSIFMSKDEATKLREGTGVRVNRPLEPATLRRVAKGVHRFVLTAADPFLVLINHEGDGFRGQALTEPMCTLTARRDAHGVVSPTLARVAHGDEDRSGKKRGKGEHSIEEPLPTVMASPEFATVQTHLVRTDMTSAHERNGVYDLEEPLRTQMSSNAFAAVQTHLMTMRNSEKPHTDSNEPTHTITAGGAGLAAVEAHLVAPHIQAAQHGGSMRDGDEPVHTITASRKDQNCLAAVHLTKFTTGSVGQMPTEPVPTLTCAHSDYHPGGALPLGVVEAHLAAGTMVQMGYGEHEGQPPRALDIDKPLGTAVAQGNKFAAVTADLHAAFIAQNNNHNGEEGHAGRDAEQPLSTICGSGSHAAVASAGLINMRGSDRRMAGTDKPVNTITGQGNHLGAIGVTLIKYYGTDQKPDLRAPLDTATTKDRFGLVEVETASLDLSEEQRYAAWWCARFMEDYGPEEPKPLYPHSRASMLGVGGYVVVDITLRMLMPRELYSAQGFPPDYKIDIDYKGKPLSKAAQTRMCGNSVPPPLARALVAANCPHLAVQSEAA